MEREMNKFEQVILTSMRARELAEGINVTPEMEGRKITTIAMDELNDGSLSFGEEKEGEDGDGE
jgi:DNA-directed RNA polymerase subunit K/omega